MRGTVSASFGVITYQFLNIVNSFDWSYFNVNSRSRCAHLLVMVFSACYKQYFTSNHPPPQPSTVPTSLLLSLFTFKIKKLNMLSFVAFATLFFTVFAEPTPTVPAPGAVYTQGAPCTVQWNADTSGSSTWKSMTIQLMTGDNDNMIPLTSSFSFSTSAVSKFSFSCWDCRRNKSGKHCLHLYLSGCKFFFLIRIIRQLIRGYR